MKRNRDILDMLREKGEELDIPEGLKPEWMEETLREYEKKKFQKTHWPSVLGAAACICLAAGMLLHVYQNSAFFFQGDSAQTKITGSAAFRDQMSADILTEEQELLEPSNLSYEEIYACLSGNWKKQNSLTRGEAEEELMAAADLTGVMQKQQTADASYGKTNLQVEQVDEADQIKNDGRYLYQIAEKQIKGGDGAESFQTGIQILDTKDGLKELAFLDDFESLEEFYLWQGTGEDLLITIENKYYTLSSTLQTAKKRGDAAVCDLLYEEKPYHEISIYEVTDKSHPRKRKTYTLQGIYYSSRVSEGYFYGISRFTARPGDGEEDYDAYIPSIDGKQIEAEQIYCPTEAKGTEYLVLISIDLSNPLFLADSRAILMGSGICYVSQKNIYVSWYQSVYERELQEAGEIKDTTRILRFSYQKGRFYGQAEGEIPGRLESSFSVDEYEGSLRTVVTVQEYEARAIVDERTEEQMGYDYGEAKETNALYILDSSLSITGKVEGLAEGETIRSARFLGEMGYFVTFRQTDPLFAVDLSDPEQPEVLDELKVSGFSEYLHFYGENQLLGIGMEADEETGQEQGIKLSMFDVSNPAEIKETTRLHLKDYNYSEALWEHRAVFVDTEENLLGFQAEGSVSGKYQADYLLFTYRDGGFIQLMKADTRTEKDYGSPRVRGTFIGNTFYLLFRNGTVRAYDRDTGALLEEL